MTPRFAQREHVGFALQHFNLDFAQASQLSRSLGAVGPIGWRLTGDGNNATAMVLDIDNRTLKWLCDESFGEKGLQGSGEETGAKLVGRGIRGIGCW